jgi:group I intron endonuclease
MKIGIYKIENTATNKVYIGQSINIDRRFKDHRQSLKTLTCNDKIKVDAETYGNEVFVFNIIELCEADRLDSREGYYVKKYNSIVNGYNIGSVTDDSILENVNCDYIMNDLITKIKKARLRTDSLWQLQQKWILSFVE